MPLQPIEELDYLNENTPLPLEKFCESLYARCCAALEPFPELEYFKWTNTDVCKWIENLGFPQYKNTFQRNKINGRTLLSVDASALCRMNIKGLDHILIIAKKIRKLFNVEKILFNRSISLPPRYPGTHYKLYRAFTGRRYEQCQPWDLFRKMEIVHNHPPQIDHYGKLTEWLTHRLERNDIYVGQLSPFESISSMSFLNRKRSTVSEIRKEISLSSCRCVPPCECKWEEKNYRMSWILNCLKEEKIAETDLRDGDIVITEEPINVTNNNIDESRDFASCKLCACIPPCECYWKERELQPPKVLTVVRFTPPKIISSRRPVFTTL